MSMRNVCSACALAVLGLAACGDRMPPAAQAGDVRPVPATPSVPDPSVPPAQSTPPSIPTAKDDPSARSSSSSSGQMTREQESSAMPMPGQANTHSSTALDPAARAASAPRTTTP